MNEYSGIVGGSGKGDLRYGSLPSAGGLLVSVVASSPYLAPPFCRR